MKKGCDYGGDRPGQDHEDESGSKGHGKRCPRCLLDLVL